MSEEIEELKKHAQEFDRQHRSGTERGSDEVEQSVPTPSDTSVDVRDFSAGEAKMWAVHGLSYFPCESTVPTLPPGQYSIAATDTRGIFFNKHNVCLDELIVLPDSASEEILKGIEYFWTQEAAFRKFGFLWKRGLLLWGPAGCHAAGTKVIMFDGSTKNVEDIQVGDTLMGPDSEPRKVYEAISGSEQMYEITPVRGGPFVVNENHILSLRISDNIHRNYPPVMNIKVKDFLNLSHCAKRRLKLYKPGCIHFPNEKNNLFDPYFIGVWLGDGSSNRVAVTTADVEIENYIKYVANKYDCHITESGKPGAKCRTYAISSDVKARPRGRSNPIANIFKEYNLIDNKHIPKDYLYSSEKDRLELLAGLLDTDGSYEQVSGRHFSKWQKKGYKGYFEITQKRTELANNIVFLARSLGFRVYIRKCIKTIKAINFIGEYNRISICGDVHRIPIKIERKRASLGKPNKDHLRVGIKSINPIGQGNYYGFNISGDRLYLTEDFFVHHNSGKTSLVQILSKKIVELGGFSVYVNCPDIDARGLALLRRIEPNRPIVVIIEDIDAIIRRYNEATVLALFDGELQIDNVTYLATTNYPGRLDPRIINRPSRFDVVKKIGMPSAASRKVYLEHKHPSLSHDDLISWVNQTEDFSFAHLKEVIVAVECLGQRFEDTINRLRQMMDIDKLPEFGEDYKKDNPAGFGFGGNGALKEVQYIETKERRSAAGATRGSTDFVCGHTGHAGRGSKVQTLPSDEYMSRKFLEHFRERRVWKGHSEE